MSNLFRSTEEPIFALVDRWIIDYFSRLLWKHFEEHGTVGSEWIDGFIQERRCIQVLQTQPGDNLDLLELQSRLLIQFMCRMSAGSFGTTIVNTDFGDGRTEFEEAIELLEQIIVIGNHGMTSTDLLRIRISVKQQAVFACCREGNFELAAKVFFRQWKSWKTQEEMEARRNIAEVLDSKNHVHEHLKSMTFDKTLSDCKHILRKIFNSMAPPFLITAAKNVWERMKNEDVVKEAESNLSDIIKVKKEQTDKGVLFNTQNDGGVSDALVNEVCAHDGSTLNSTSSVAGLQILCDSKEPGIYAPSETLLTMMPPANKSHTYPLILWTNSISPNVLSPRVSAASVQISDEAQVTVSRSFMQQRKEAAGPKQRMYLSLSSNQFSMPEEIYLNTVPVVSSQVYATTPLLQERNSLVDSGSIQQMWNIPATTIANEEFLSGNTAVMTETEPAVVLKRNRKRSRRKASLDLTQVAETSLSTAPISQSPPLMIETSGTSPTTKRRGRPPGKKNSAESVTPVLEVIPACIENEIVSSPATYAKCPRITPSVSLQPKKDRLFRKSKNQFVSDSGKNLAAEKVPVVCLTKISSQILQNLPSAEVYKTSQNSNTRSLATELRHTPTDNFNESSDYVPKTRRGHKSSRLSPSVESLPRANRNSKVCNDPWISDIQPSSSESVESKRKRSSSPAKKQVAYSSQRGMEKMSSMLSSHVQPTSEKSSKTKKGVGTKLPWEPNEIDDLYKAVQKYGSHWVMISRCEFPNRLPGDLSNKWRSILFGKELKLLEKKFGPV